MAKLPKRKLTDVTEDVAEDVAVTESVQEQQDATIYTGQVVINSEGIRQDAIKVQPGVRVVYKRVDKEVGGPFRATPGSAGFDLFARERVVIVPGATALVPLNVIVKIPSGHVGLLAIRSGLARQGIVLANGVGVIDSDYHGPHDEIAALLYNTTPQTYVVGRGQRVAQLLIVPLLQAHGEIELVETDEDLRPEDRRGFGSTGY